MISIFALAVLLLVIFWLRWRWSNKRLLDMAKKFPGPKTLPFLGNAWLFMCKPEEQMAIIKDLLTEYGDVVRFWLGPDLNFFINNPEDVKTLLTNPKTSFKGPQYKYMSDILGGGILSGSGPAWRLHRKLAAPNYGMQAVETYSDVFNKEMDLLIEDLKTIPKGQMFNIYHNVVKATTYSVCQALMGLSKKQTMDLPNLQNVIEKSARLYDIIFNRMTKWYLQIDPVFWISNLNREQNRTLKMVKEFCKAIIKHREMKQNFKSDENDSELSIIDRFIDSKIMDEESLWQETMTIFTSSQEAGAKIASFLLLMMAYHPACQEKLYAEITSVLGDDVWVTGDHFKRMPYLDMVFKEVIRLFPTGAMIQRSIQEDIQISSGTLPAGSSLAFSIYHLQRDPRFWTNPDSFDPERFSPENTKMRNPNCFIPFSLGPMDCLGSGTLPAGSSLAFSIYHLQRDPRFWTNPDSFDPERFSPENTKMRNPNCFIPFSLGPMDCLGRHFGAKLVKTVCVRILRKYRLSSLDQYKDLKVYIAISAKSLNGYRVILNPRN